MYDMYAYDETVLSDGGSGVRPGESGSEFSEALQFALDRRDNGGDAQGHPHSYEAQ
ncbi:MAG TPA: hypothetical protein VG142_11125 [Trebonia sp.]|nr:hypothetical protein [Trebonia sp.]